MNGKDNQAARDMGAARNDVSGTLFIRNTSKEVPDGSGRRLVMVFGVLAVGEEFTPKPEHQYPVVGTANGLHLILAEGHEISCPDAAGWRADQLLTEEMWRV